MQGGGQGGMVERKSAVARVLPHVVLIFGVCLVSFPVYLALVASSWDAATVANGKMGLTFGPHLIENYWRVLTEGTGSSTRAPVGMMMLNSLIMACLIAGGKILISILSAYAIVYYRFPFRMAAFWLIFVTLMLPVEVRIYPTYKIVADLRMLDTYAGLTIPLIASATGTLLFRQFFLTVPDELLEASKIDGAGPFRFFKDTLLPLSMTTIAALFVIQFIYGWNQYLWPLLITTRDDMQTIVIGIRKMITTADALTEWQLAMATAILAMLPPVAVVVLMQRLFVKGLVDTEK
jgi:sn-glycerol 3-phosphate transport system permease protein